jgi:hypothetical protein
MIKFKDIPNLLNLEPQDGSSQKSFYKKAKVFTDKDENDNVCTYLLSYDTLVGKYNHEKDSLHFNGWFSMTTQKHQSAFSQFFGFKALNKRDILDITYKPLTKK